MVKCNDITSLVGISLSLSFGQNLEVKRPCLTLTFPNNENRVEKYKAKRSIFDEFGGD